MANPADFTGTPFVMGSIIGEKTLKVGKGGRLVSPAVEYDWESTENVCTCRKSNIAGGVHPEKIRMILERYVLPGRQILSFDRPFGANTLRVHWRDTQETMVAIPPRLGVSIWVTEGDEKRAVELETIRYRNEGTIEVPWSPIMRALESLPHEFATCECGFYAYMNGENEYQGLGRIIAVIEGYGETLIGTRGFRSEKAKILALAPSPASQDLAERMSMALTAGGSVAPMVVSGGSGGSRLIGSTYTSQGLSSAEWDPADNPPPVAPESAKANTLRELAARSAPANKGVGGANASAGTHTGGGGGTGGSGSRGAAAANAVFGVSVASGQAGVQAVVAAQGAGVLFIPQVLGGESVDTDKKIPWDKIRERYPDVVIFDSVEEMRKQFPVTTAEEARGE